MSFLAGAGCQPRCTCAESGVSAAHIVVPSALAVSQVLFMSAVGHEAGAPRAAGLSLCWGLCTSCVRGQAVGPGRGSAWAGTPVRATRSLLPSSWGGVLGRVHGVGTGWPQPGLGTGDGGLQAPRGGLRALGDLLPALKSPAASGESCCENNKRTVDSLKATLHHTEISLLLNLVTRRVGPRARGHPPLPWDVWAIGSPLARP